jgi:hypothetical protein
MIDTIASCSKNLEGAEAKADSSFRRLKQLLEFRQRIQKLEQGKIQVKPDRGTQADTPFRFEIKTTYWVGIYQINPAERSAKGLRAIRKT